MNDADCVELLRWALPHLHMRWRGFRKVRRQVCKRVQRRMRDISITDVPHYRAYLQQHREEWSVLRDLCRVTISRFYRDKGIFQALEKEVLPALARRAIAGRRRALSAWSAGCGSGEEPYTLALVWRLRLQQAFPSLLLRILATDIDEVLLARAANACYSGGTLRDLPTGWRDAGFDVSDTVYCLRREFKCMATFQIHDVCSRPPALGFDLILCRNLLYTYFDQDRQGRVTRLMVRSLEPGGVLVVGAHERPPAAGLPLTPWPRQGSLFQKTGTLGAPAS